MGESGVQGTMGRWRTYCEFARSPQPLNDAEVVESHGCEEDFCRVRVACLRITPRLSVGENITSSFHR